MEVKSGSITPPRANAPVVPYATKTSHKKAQKAHKAQKETPHLKVQSTSDPAWIARALFVLFVPSVPFVALLLDRDPNTVGAAVEQCRSEQPRTLAVIAKALSVQVEVPIAVSQPELIAGCGRV